MKRPLLVVEDNPQDEFFILRALDALGILREVARDGEEALLRLLSPQREGPLPCAVFLDIMLPRVNGWEVLRQLRENSRTRYLPVVMFSSSAEPRDLESCYRLGANGYVHKGIDTGEFQKRVQAMAEFWVKTNIPLP